jgi:hypothetical protein
MTGFMGDELAAPTNAFAFSMNAACSFTSNFGGGVVRVASGTPRRRTPGRPSQEAIRPSVVEDRQVKCSQTLRIAEHRFLLVSAL